MSKVKKGKGVKPLQIDDKCQGCCLEVFKDC